MKLNKHRYPLVRLPHKMELCLYLIQEELKTRKLFNTLHEVGLEESCLRPTLDSLILQAMGIEESDESFQRYNSILEKRAEKVVADLESIRKQTNKAYRELLAEKEKLAG